MHKNSLFLFEKYVKPLIRDGHKVLEVGPNAFPSDYRKMVDKEVEWDTLDLYEHEGLTYSNSKMYDFAIQNGTYDIVLSGQVMEHVKKIWLWVAELERICKPGGKVAIISPVSWPYHEAPVDCWRIYPDGMKSLLEDFTSLELEHCNFESLETPHYSRHMPGMSIEWVSSKLRKFYKVFGPLGFPVQKSYDLVTVARKP